MNLSGAECSGRIRPRSYRKKRIRIHPSTCTVPANPALQPYLVEGGKEGGPGHEELTVLGALLLHPLHVVAPRVPHTHLATRDVDPGRFYPDPYPTSEKKTRIRP